MAVIRAAHASGVFRIRRLVVAAAVVGCAGPSVAPNAPQSTVDHSTAAERAEAELECVDESWERADGSFVHAHVMRATPRAAQAAIDRLGVEWREAASDDDRARIRACIAELVKWWIPGWPPPRVPPAMQLRGP